MSLLFGNCSWNYDSWVGLVYTKKCSTAADYLYEYCKKYRTAEIDSWFYKIPDQKEVLKYKENVDNSFRFTCKVPESISLTHFRNKVKTTPLVSNPDFLSPEKFNFFLNQIKPLLSMIDGIMLEFEYLNKEKMPSLNHFLDHLKKFIKSVPPDIPLAIEPRNQNYLTTDYFSMIKENNIIHVFSEKEFMPPIVTVYEKFEELIPSTVIIRLLGGNRKAMEEKTNEQWNKIVEEKPQKKAIAQMIKRMLSLKKNVIMNVNNHYEGSSPLTIATLENLISHE